MTLVAFSEKEPTPEPLVLGSVDCAAASGAIEHTTVKMSRATRASTSEKKHGKVRLLITV
jgi:hypothetical protein